MVSENEVDFMVQSHRKSQGSSCISDRRLIVATPVQDIMKVFQHIARRESSHRVEVSLKVQLFDERLRGSPGSPGSPVLLGEDKRLMAQSGTKVSAISDQRMFQMYPNVSKCIQMYPNVSKCSNVHSCSCDFLEDFCLTIEELHLRSQRLAWRISAEGIEKSAALNGPNHRMGKQCL